jgi:hypothetical protein
MLFLKSQSGARDPYGYEKSKAKQIFTFFFGKQDSHRWFL